MFDILGDAGADFNPNDLRYDKAGIKPPETVDDLIAAGKALTTDKVKGIFVGNDGGVIIGGPALWSSGGAYLGEDNEPGFTGARAAQAFAKLRELYTSKSLLLGAPTDWADPSAFIQGLTAIQWCGLWAMPAIQKALGDDFGVFAYPKLDVQGRPALPSGGWTQFVSAKSPNIDDAKALVKFLWVDNLEFQEDWNLNYGFHIPPRKSLAARATKLQQGAAAEVVKLNRDHGIVDLPAWTPKMITAFNDLTTNVIRKGADPAAEIKKAEKTVTTELSRLFG